MPWLYRIFCGHNFLAILHYNETCLRQPPVLTDLYKEMAALQRETALFYCYLGHGMLTVLERWLPNTVTILDRFHRTH